MKAPRLMLCMACLGLNSAPAQVTPPVPFDGVAGVSVVGSSPVRGYGPVAPPVSFTDRLDLLRKRAGLHTSMSRQFVVQDEERTGWLPTVTDTNLVRLEPNLLTVSCERIKHDLLKELGMARDEWRGQVHLELHPARNLNEEPLMYSTLFPSGWDYRVQLPDAMERRHFVSTIVEVLLIEYANRENATRSAEIPPWLTQGLTRQMLLNANIDLVLQPPMRSEGGINVLRVNRDEEKKNPLTLAHDELRAEVPLSLDELSWPDEHSLTGPRAETFRSSAQLLVCELLSLPDGKACMKKFLRRLPAYLNWQLAFQEAFHSDFATQRDFEKWWALRLANFTQRELTQGLSPADSWQHLLEIIHPEVQVRRDKAELPLRAKVELQTVIREWDYTHQIAVLHRKVEELTVLAVESPREIRPLAEGYRHALLTYLGAMEKAGVVPLTQTMVTPKVGSAARAALRDLDGLDARLQMVHPTEQAAATPKKEFSLLSAKP